MIKIREASRAYLRRAQAYVEQEIAVQKILMLFSHYRIATYGQLRLMP